LHDKYTQQARAFEMLHKQLESSYMLATDPKLQQQYLRQMRTLEVDSAELSESMTQIREKMRGQLGMDADAVNSDVKELDKRYGGKNPLGLSEVKK
jgi:hypothetical protein